MSRIRFGTVNGLYLLFIGTLAFLYQGCGSVGAVGVSPSSANVSIGQKAFFTAKAINPSAQFSWEVNGIPGGNSTVGTVVWSGTATGFIGVYTAPASIPASPAVTVTALLNGNPASRGSASVNVGPFISISPTVNTSVQTYSSMQFFATVTGAPNSAVTWQVGCHQGGTACGAISQTGLFHAPNSVPTTPEGSDIVPDVVMVRAVSQADSRFSGSEPVPISSLNQQPQQAPIQLGASGSNANDICPTGPVCLVGTLGSLVARGGVQYVLSNAHVLARPNGGTTGDAILQPGLQDTGCDPVRATTVANLSQFTNPQIDSGTKVDAAIAQVASGAVDPSGAVLELGPIVVNGVPQPGAPAQGPGMAASVNELVAKSGRSTGLTCASVEAVNVSTKVTDPSFCSSAAFTVTFTDEVAVTNTGFSAAGDSGSLIVDATTTQPVALLFALDSSTAIGNPVSDVLNVLKDANGNAPTFVGGAPHVVAGCSLSPPTAMATSRDSTAVAARVMQRAQDVVNQRAAELLANLAVSVGVGPSLDAPGEAAVILVLRKDAPRDSLPQEIDGIRTRVVETDTSPLPGLLDASQTEQLIAQVSPKVFKAPSKDAMRSALAVKEENADQWMSDPAIQGVGVASSLDNPEEPSLIFYVLKGKPHTAIPITIGGFRTRFKETLGFTAGVGSSRSSPACRAFPRGTTGGRILKK